MSTTFSESLAVGTFEHDACRVSDPVHEYMYTSGSTDHRIGGRIFFARIMVFHRHTVLQCSDAAARGKLNTAPGNE